jgi:sulfur-carrier protein
MAITVSIPTALRQYAGGSAAVTLPSGSVGEVLAGLVEQHPQLGKQLYNEQGQLRNFVNIYVGDEDIRYLQGPETPVPEGETISIIPAIAGGATR